MATKTAQLEILGIVPYSAGRYEIQGRTAGEGGPSRRVAIVDRIEDATLLAAAPDLLEALKQLLPITWNDGPLSDAYREIGARAEAAIQKAEGR